MFKISGLDQLSRQLEQAQEAFGELDGELGTVQFDPSDPASIEAAIENVEQLFESRVARWPNNPLVRQVADGLKEQYREAILDRAVQARLEASD
ncbi:hypothetical protein [Pseudoxanthomonas winnipegensis]|uniref:hypothetical protein n=1 Tax=Pseudoxanthomonas winnipegensis TaxID=2480810 RepID=UPI003F82D9C5